MAHVGQSSVGDLQAFLSFVPGRHSTVSLGEPKKPAP